MPAIKRGITWPTAKLPRKIVPLRGLPCLETHARSTARTGVVQGEDANPNAKPAEIGANAAGTLFFQISGSGPDGSENFKSPSRFSPIINANRLMNIEKMFGN